MKKITLLFILIFSLSLSVIAQDEETVTVIAIKANLRGTPDAKGVIVTTANQNEIFELIKQSGEWFLVQTPKYVGWVHGSTIKLNNYYDAEYDSEPKGSSPTQTNTPKPTSKPATDDGVFQETYIGGNSRPTITIKNDTDRLVTLVFGGATYKIKSQEAMQLIVDEGNYEYFASAPRVRPTSGVKEYKNGYGYSWTFYIGKTKY